MYLQIWVKTHFRRTDLSQLGVRIQLGHSLGEKCPNPKRTFNDDFTVIDTTGIHRISVDYCDCERKCHLPIQLMRARLFPATVINPKTAATYRVLEQFHLLRTQSKVSAYEFYNALARCTDNVQPESTKVSAVGTPAGYTRLQPSSGPIHRIPEDVP